MTWENLIGSENIFDVINNEINKALVKFVIDMVIESLKCLNIFTAMGIMGDIVTNIHGVILGIASIALIIIITYKIINNLISISTGGSDYVPTGQLIWDTVKSSVGTFYLPMLVTFVAALLPELQGEINKVTLETVLNNLMTLRDKMGQDGFQIIMINSIFPMFMLYCIMSIANFIYFFTICKMQIDFVILQILAPVAAIDHATNNKEFFTTWKKTLISISISMIIKVILLAVMIQTSTQLVTSSLSGQTSFEWAMVIGCAICIIKEPEIIKNYRYNTGLGQNVSHALSGLVRAVPGIFSGIK